MKEGKKAWKIVKTGEKRRKIETAPYFSFLCFSPTHENNKAIKTIKTKGRGCGETHTPKDKVTILAPQLW